jgi:hypothetical protein
MRQGFERRVVAVLDGNEFILGKKATLGLKFCAHDRISPSLVVDAIVSMG